MTTVNITVVTPPANAAGYIIITDTPSIEVTSTTTVTVNLQVQPYGGTPGPAAAGTWQFPSLPTATPAAGRYLLSFGGLSFYIEPPSPTRWTISQLITPGTVNPSSVQFTVNQPDDIPTTTTVSIRYRVQVVNQLAAASLFLDPTIRDQGSGS